MGNMEEFFGSSNAGAYEKEEIRKGPPLSYVAEKMESSIVAQYSAIKDIARDISGKNIEEKENSGSQYLATACAAFQYQLIAYLALQNMLAQFSGTLMYKLLNGSFDELEKWLLLIRSEGSVLG